MHSPRIASLPKAELHLHLEGSVRPAIVAALAARHGISVTEEEVRQRYNYADFAGFINAFKWVTSLLRDPQDYALIAQDLAEQLLAQNVIYAEVTLSIGVMQLRHQQVEANFEAILAATAPYLAQGLRFNWIFDAVRQFGPGPAMQVVEAARSVNNKSIVAFGIGGDELSVPSEEFRAVYDRAAENGFHRLIHAGETGGPEKIREAIEILGVERIGHGIAAIHDPALMDLLASRQIPLEICPTSNLCTGALARQLHQSHATLRDHPLAKLFRHGIPILISTDDPAMFHTTLSGEYERAQDMGLTEEELARLVGLSFNHSFSGG
ncbi:MAG TPA: adenosine deaminase [Candidatus Dormibacteraeota bacterium]|nr:adenosine deaminase [Candidatus Dormibacteraeota bacterium]